MSHADFDPELYLRLLGERDLAAGVDLSHRHHGRASLLKAAAALSVTGVITPELAEAITSDYSLASMVSQESQLLQHRRHMAAAQPAGRANPEPLKPRRTYALDATLAVPGGRLALGVLVATPEGGQFRGEFSSDTDLSGHGGGPPALTVRFPSGHRTQTTFGGGWGGNTAEGQFSFTGELSDRIPWLEIAGHRLELPAPAPPTPVTIESLSPDGRALRYLWQLVADFNGRHNHSGLASRAASDALLHAGLIDADDPEVEALLWVADAQAGLGPRMFRRHRGQPPSPAVKVPAGVPPAWRSVLQSPVTGPRPLGTLALAAATPVFDQLSVALNALRSARDSATLEVTATETLFHDSSRPVAFWAEDDRGNHYLGESGSWGGGGAGITSGEIMFGPLHPKAAVLTVAVTTLDARALIPITLDWPEREPAT